MGVGVLALDLARQPGQAVEQLRLLVAVGAADRLRQFGQFTLGMGQHLGRFTRGGQAQECRHAVGFNLQQPLHQPPQTAWCHAARQQDHARKAVGMDGKVGVHLTMAVGHGGRNQGVLQQHMFNQRRRAEHAGGQHPQVQRGQALPG